MTGEKVKKNDMNIISSLYFIFSYLAYAKVSAAVYLIIDFFTRICKILILFLSYIIIHCNYIRCYGNLKQFYVKSLTCASSIRDNYKQCVCSAVHFPFRDHLIEGDTRPRSSGHG